MAQKTHISEQLNVKGEINICVYDWKWKYLEYNKRYLKRNINTRIIDKYSFEKK